MFQKVEEELRKTLVSSAANGISDSLSVAKLQHLPPTYRLWGLVVEHYTQCNLTKSEDKLVAISCIARLLEAFLPGGISFRKFIWIAEAKM